MGAGMTIPETYCLFDTEFGLCGIAWSAGGLRRVQLPEADAAATRARLEKGGAVEGEPPATLAWVLAALAAYFDGAETDFTSVTLDLPADTTDERRRIYDAARLLRWGETASYGEVARRAGMPHGAQAVGQAMAANPAPIVIPCHRVLAAGGRLGGFSAYGGALTKERLLVLERARLL
jgi:methylated-DNA-[protein]-cysteine S-methyltransferase